MNETMPHHECLSAIKNTQPKYDRISSHDWFTQDGSRYPVEPKGSTTAIGYFGDYSARYSKTRNLIKTHRESLPAIKSTRSPVTQSKLDQRLPHSWFTNDGGRCPIERKNPSIAIGYVRDYFGRYPKTNHNRRQPSKEEQDARTSSVNQQGDHLQRQIVTMCENLNQDRIRCEPCRTINLAKHIKQPKPDMQLYDKCSPTQRIECSPVTEVPLHPTCIKVCSKEEYKLKKSGKTMEMPKMPLPYGHGKLMYAVKAGILVGAVYFTYTQGVWGDQQDVTECIRRWQEYLRSINTRRPPVFDQCGNVVRKETTDTFLAPLYSMYKTAVTTSFAGVVKVPLLIKCAYFDYLEALRKKQEEDDKERKIKKRSSF